MRGPLLGALVALLLTVAAVPATPFDPPWAGDDDYGRKVMLLPAIVRAQAIATGLVTIPLGNETQVVNVTPWTTRPLIRHETPNGTIEAPLAFGTAVTENGSEIVRLPPVSTFRGTLVSDPTSRVVLLLDGEEVRVFARTATGSYFVEASGPSDPSGAREHRTYSSAEAPGGKEDPDERDFVTQSRESRAPGPWFPWLTAPLRLLFGLVSGAASAAVGSTDETAYVAAVADNDFYINVAGSNLDKCMNEMEFYLNAVSDIMEDQFRVRLSNSDPTCIVSGNGGLTATDRCLLLDQFRDSFPSDATASTACDVGTGDTAPAALRNLAHLFTGKTLDGTHLGRAMSGHDGDGIGGRNHGVGTPRSYSLTQHVWKPGIGYFANTHQQTIITAHEIGHTLNGNHANAAGAACGATVVPACRTIMSEWGLRPYTERYSDGSDGAALNNVDRMRAQSEYALPMPTKSATNGASAAQASSVSRYCSTGINAVQPAAKVRALFNYGVGETVDHSGWSAPTVDACFDHLWETVGQKRLVSRMQTHSTRGQLGACSDARVVTVGGVGSGLDLLRDGQFECYGPTDPNSWIDWGLFAPGCVHIVEETPPPHEYSGAFRRYIKDTDPAYSCGFYQDVAVVAGVEIAARAKLDIRGYGTGIDVWLEWLDVDFALLRRDVATVRQSGMQVISAAGVAPVGSSVVRLFFYSPTASMSEFFVDDVSLKHVTGTQRLENGGFETGTFSGWTTFGACASVSSGWKAEGAFSARLVDTSTTESCGIFQTEPVTSGREYAVRASFNVQSLSGGPQVWLEWLDTRGGRVHPINLFTATATGVTTVAASGFVPVGAVTARVWIYVPVANRADVYVDDVRLKAV